MDYQLGRCLSALGCKLSEQPGIICVVYRANTTTTMYCNHLPTVSQYVAYYHPWRSMALYLGGKNLLTLALVPEF